MKKISPSEPLRPALREAVHDTAERCIECGLCVRECAFLRKYGTPKTIAQAYDPETSEGQARPFECSLCGLCRAVCPVSLDPAALFLEMRREAVARGAGDLPEHEVIRGFERRGTSKAFTLYALPQGCDTVFFPGCALPGSRPDKVFRLYEHLAGRIAGLGLVLDCCTKPSHDLGDQAHFDRYFGELKAYLLDHGVRRVLVACPNCYKVFRTYGGEIAVQSIYEVLAENPPPEASAVTGTVTIHDPCAVRFEDGLHDAARRLVKHQGLEIREMPHRRRKTVCCGEGGSVGFVAPELAGRWGAIRTAEAQGERTATYCAGCAGHLAPLTPTFHLVDLMLEPEAALEGQAKVSRPPVTYWNRLRLKRRFKKTIPARVTRERPNLGEKAGPLALVKKLGLVALLVAAIVGIRLSGGTEFLEQDRLRALISGYGALAPVIYMLVYTVAPALFLPGLPITVVGGVLFGPVWGVVYTIFGATAGATLAFLIGRYVGRDWIARRLRGPRWGRLDAEVERHGWKVVLFTRLIPLFPFNLLNYAFGLTRVRLTAYLVPTFFGMLPGCVAYILFSSSLLDAVRGRFSGTFLLGLALMVVISLAPIGYRTYRRRQERAAGSPARP